MLRNNVRACIRIPQYANLTVYNGCYHLTVTFQIKDSTIPYIRFKESSIWKVDLFYRNNRHYLTAIMDVPFSKIVNSSIPMEDWIWHYSSEMCNNLKVILREAKIRELQDEVKQLTLF